MLDISTLLLISCSYIALVFLAGISALKGWLPQKAASHPVTYSLSLGGYVGIWALFGMIELAQNEGYMFLTYFIGTSALFLFSPLLLQPLVKLSRTYRLNSMADLFSFRYASQTAGLLICIGTLLAIMPMLALQMHSLTESVSFLVRLDPASSAQALFWTPLAFCLVIATLAVVFSPDLRGRNDRHQGLIVATAFQSLVKLILFMGLGVIAIVQIFGSPEALETWLLAHPDKLSTLNQSLANNNSRSLTLIFFAAALSFPHMYHLAVTENPQENSVRHASWGYPFYLLLLSLPILPIMWAGQASDTPIPSFFLALSLGETLQTPVFSLMGYLCGLAAATSSSSVIVITVASMCMNHLILPYHSTRKKKNLYLWLATSKSVLMIALVLAGYISYQVIGHFNAFQRFSFAAYTAAFQFLPGILACFYWPRGNRTGLVAGLVAGFVCWGLFILLPLFSPDAFGMLPIFEKLFNLNGNSYWIVAAIACLGINMLAFGMVSLSAPANEEERNAAALCSPDNLGKPSLQQLALNTVDEFIQALSPAIGEDTARREISQALSALKMQMDERRPFALRLLRRQIESNLSGLFGPTVARQLVSRHIPYTASSLEGQTRHDIQLIEHRLENDPDQLSGMAAELDRLRRYHRNTIEQLPIGVCMINNDGEILTWNQAMASLTSIDAATALGTSIANLASPWNTLFSTFIASDGNEIHNHPLQIDSQTRWFTLHKTRISETDASKQNCSLLIEEVTALVKLEHDLLHNERLASIGRLAAGVAHEIGNPVTGIACLAQNLKYDSDTPEIAETARDILAQTQRITRIVQSLISFSHAGAHTHNFHSSPVNLHECAEDAIHLLSLDQRKATDAIHNRIDPLHVIQGDMQRLQQVLLNLLKNALDACTESPSITLESRRAGNTIELLVTDNGSGIPASLQDQIFEPFFTTKDPGEGTGLGLAVVYSIIEEHHGHITVHSPVIDGKTGTRFIISLPLAA